MRDLIHYQRNLPHRLVPGESLFLTMRLAGSMPKIALEQLQADFEAAELAALRSGYAGLDTYARQKRYFGRFDQLLDCPTAGLLWLQQSPIAKVVAESLHYFDKRYFQLVAYCVMPNHVHVVLTLANDDCSLLRSLQRFKSYTALQANRLLHRQGQFWQRESYDHLIRDATEMTRIISYVLENPVKAGLTNDWQTWPYSYWRES